LISAAAFGRQHPGNTEKIIDGAKIGEEFFCAPVTFCLVLRTTKKPKE
jgi:hypothetical protein